MLHVCILGALSLLSSLIYGFHFVHHSPSLTRKLCKVAAVGSLAVISAFSGGPLLLTLALVLGAIGDGFLAWRGERNFLLGLVAFLFGHLTYIGLLSGFSDGLRVLIETPWRLAACAALVGVALKVVHLLLPHLGAMRLPVLVYACVILVMGVTALTLPLVWPLVLAIVGSKLFIASDAILGFELFVVKDVEFRKRWPATLLWTLYWGGQSLIVLGILLGGPQVGGA